MYMGRQFKKEARNKISRQIECSGTQQRVQIGRKTQSNQIRQQMFNDIHNRPIQRAALLLIQDILLKKKETNIEKAQRILDRKTRLIDAASAVGSGTPIGMSLVEFSKGEVISSQEIKSGTIKANDNIDIFGHAYHGKPAGMEANVLMQLLKKSFAILPEWSGCIRIFSCYSSPYNLHLAEAMGTNFKELTAVSGSSEKMILNPYSHGAIFPEHSNWQDLVKMKKPADKMIYIHQKLGNDDPRYLELGTEIEENNFDRWAFWEEYYNNIPIQNQGWMIAKKHIHKHHHKHGRAYTWENRKSSFIGDDPGQIGHVGHVSYY